MHCNRRDYVVWMSDLCSKCPLIGFHKIQTKEIKCRQFSPSPCLFAEPEAVSKHSVSLWIGYSDKTPYNPTVSENCRCPIIACWPVWRYVKISVERCYTGKRSVIAAGQFSLRVLLWGNLLWNLIIFGTNLCLPQLMICGKRMDLLICT